MDDAEIELRMQPGAWSEDGFLAPGASLQDVLNQDARLLNSLGVDSRAIADGLSGFLSTAKDSDWAQPTRSDDHEIEIHRVRGFITCPWAPDQFESCPHGYRGRPTANRFRIVHVASGSTLEGFELTVHMIGAHGFFGGPGTPFRVDPELAARVLNLP
jgi:hypothetical protein